MLPFALKLVWMILSITGTICCWIVLSIFAGAVGSYWGPMTYCIACTMLETIFCIGMVWRMDPYQMPKAFCIAQTVIIAFSTFVLTGVCMAFSIATCHTAFKPKSWGSLDSNRKALAWRPIYALIMVVFPVVASAVQVAVIVKLDPVKPSNDLHCDASDPEWVRFLGYAGSPLLLAIPCLIISIKSMAATIRTSRHIMRSRSEELEFSHVAPMPGYLRLQRIFHRNHSSTVPTTTRTDHHDEEDRFHDTNSTGPLSSSASYPNSPSVAHIERDRNSTANPDFSAIMVEGSSGPPSGDESDDVSSLVWASSSNNVPATSDDIEKEDLHSLTDGEITGTDLEFTAISKPPTSSHHGIQALPRRFTKPPPAFLAPYIWRIMLFQLAFASVLLLACISPLVDVITRQSEPTPFGTQHVALILAAWGPAIVFGHLPVVRNKLLFWRARPPS